MFIPSKYQEAVFDAIKNSNKNLIIEAVAGSGKTKTIEEAIKLLNPCMQVCYLVFNKKNQLEAAAKLPTWVTVSTFNAFGHKICNKIYGFSKPDARKTRNTLLSVSNFEYQSKDRQNIIWKWAYSIEKLVSLAKGYNWNSTHGIATLAEKHGIEIPREEGEYFELLNKTFLACIHNTTVRDFDDQIYFPVQKDLPLPHFDIVFVDECQDLNPVKIELLKKLDTRIIAVGDSHQAIYGFAGADVKAIKHLRETFDAQILPLSVCYRCCKKVVEYAKKYVPHIEVFDQAPEGLIVNCSRKNYSEKLANGDYVLCRITAPLVSECLEQIRRGRKAVVLGREILESLIGLIDKVCTKTDTEEAIKQLQAYYIQESQKLQRMQNENLLILLQDKVETLKVVLGEVQTVEEAKKKLNDIFSDTAVGITYMSMHKAKGLETNKVYILQPELVPHKLATQQWQIEQEKNLMYVAVTRAKQELIFIGDPKC